MKIWDILDKCMEDGVKKISLELHGCLYFLEPVLELLMERQESIVGILQIKDLKLRWEKDLRLLNVGNKLYALMVLGIMVI